MPLPLVEEVPREIPMEVTPRIEIDFEVLRDPFLEVLQPLEPFPPFEEEAGRENPFVPFVPRPLFLEPPKPLDPVLPFEGGVK